MLSFIGGFIVGLTICSLLLIHILKESLDIITILEKTLIALIKKDYEKASEEVLNASKKTSKLAEGFFDE